MTLAAIGHCLFTQPTLAAEEIVVQLGQSIQQALDSAPAGALVRLLEGVYPERITLRKSVALVGAGAGKTLLKPDKPEPGVTPETIKAAYERLRSAQTSEQKEQLLKTYVDDYFRPTVLLEEVRDVMLKGLSVQGIRPSSEEATLTSDALLRSRASSANIEDCEFVGPYANGIQITNGGQVKIARCLVAGIWGKGISVSQSQATERALMEVVIEESTVRNCYHRCIIIGKGCDKVAVRRCHISGSAWHGIRYDDASPVIEENHIFANARSGIYASGNTKAHVRGNIISRNEMDAVSCWYHNHDLFENNIFAGNLRDGVAILGQSKPMFKRNVFAHQPISLVLSKVGGDKSGTLGQFESEDNVFWQNGTEKELPKGGRAVDPLFMNASTGDFRLSPESPLRKLKIGASGSTPLASVWPLTAGEKEMIPSSATRNFSDWTTPGKITEK